MYNHRLIRQHNEVACLMRNNPNEKGNHFLNSALIWKLISDVSGQTIGHYLSQAGYVSPPHACPSVRPFVRQQGRCNSWQISCIFITPAVNTWVWFLLNFINAEWGSWFTQRTTWALDWCCCIRTLCHDIRNENGMVEVCALLSTLVSCTVIILQRFTLSGIHFEN